MPNYKYINEYPELINRLQGLSLKIKQQKKEIDKLIKEKLQLLDTINEINEKNFQNLSLINDLENKNKKLEKENILKKTNGIL